MVTHFWCFEKNETFFMNFKLLDVFELCDEIKEDFFFY